MTVYCWKVRRPNEIFFCAALRTLIGVDEGSVAVSKSSPSVLVANVRNGDCGSAERRSTESAEISFGFFSFAIVWRVMRQVRVMSSNLLQVVQSAAMKRLPITSPFAKKSE